jgi:hypothetical protein
MVCLPTFAQWFDKNRQNLIDNSAVDAAMLMYNDILEILTTENKCDMS